MEKGPTLFELQRLENDQLEILKKCQKWGLIPNEGAYMCPKCRNPLHLGVFSNSCDGYRWICNRRFTFQKRKRKSCNTRISVRSKTFLEKSHLSIKQILGFCSMWIRSCKISYIAFELSINKATATDWGSFCREVANIIMVEKQEPIGGEEKIVEFHIGYMQRDNWVFGGFERGTGKIFMESMKDNSREILIAIINKWILPGTTVVSDCWKDYDILEKNVNPSLHFMDPETGGNINSIEVAWKSAKIAISSQSKFPENLPGNLARYMLLKKAKADGVDPVLLFYRLTGQIYNPLSEEELDIRSPTQPEEVESYFETIFMNN